VTPATSAALAASPIAVLLVLMLGLGWSTARAALAALAVTLVVALVAFDYGAGDLGRLPAVVGALAEACFAAFTIAWILLPALGIHQLQQRGGRHGPGPIDVLQRAIAQVSGEPAVVALLVAWFFALFLEGAAGFGTPVALAAPFLVSAGFRPVTAVSLALVGHAAGVSFGAVGTPLLAIASVSGLDPLALSRATAIYVALLGWMLPVAMMLRLGRAADPAAPPPPRRLGWALAAAALFIAPYLALAWLVGPELPSLGGGLLGGLAFALLWRRLAGAARPTGEDAVATRPLLVAAAPYLAIVALVLVTRLVPPVRDATDLALSFRLFDRFDGRIQLLRHPGTLLLASLVIGAAVQRVPPRDVVAALGAAARRLGPVVIALIAVLAVSRLMVHAGMIEALATAAAGAAGPLWPLVAPLVGVLGTFVTGSATASNLLFTDLQAAAAAETGVAVPRALGAQGFGAAAGNMMAPMNVVAGAATVGLVGRDGEVLRQTVAICLLYTLCGGLLTWLFHALG
jgi:lactate permease